MSAHPTEAAVAPEDRVLQLRDWVALSLPGLIWGSSFFLIAEGLDAFSPYVVSWARVACGCLALSMMPAARSALPRHALPKVALLGFVWMAAPLTLFSLAQERVSSSVTGMLNGGTPIFAALVAAILVRSMPPGRQIFGLAIGLIGIVITALPTWSEGGSTAGGVLMIGAAVACYGVALNVAGPLQREFGALPVVARAVGVALLLTTPLGLAGIGESSFAWSSFVAVVVLGAAGTGVAFMLMASNAGNYGSTRAASTTYLVPPVALALGLIFRDESVAALAIVGCAVALSGAYLVNTAVGRTR